MFINYNLPGTIDKVRLDQVIADEAANEVSDAAHLADNVKHLLTDERSIAINDVRQITAIKIKPSFDANGGLDGTFVYANRASMFFPEWVKAISFQVQNGSFMTIGGDPSSWTVLCIGPDAGSHGKIFEFTPAGFTNLGLLPGIKTAPPSTADIVRVSVDAAGNYTVDIQRNGVGDFIRWADPFNNTAIAGGTGWTKNHNFGWTKFAEAGTPLIKNIKAITPSLNNPIQQAMLDISIIKRWKGSDWNPMGDSITNFNQYQPVVQALTGIKTYQNLGVGGSCLASIDGSDVNSMAYRVNTLDGIGDIITVFGGTNDYGNIPAKPLGVMGDTVKTTVFGAINSIITDVTTWQPQAKLAFFTPLQRNYTGADPNTLKGVDATNALGYKLVDVVNAIKQVCAAWGIPVLDLYSTSGMNRLNVASLTIDGLHPNTTMMDRLGKQMAAFLNSL